MSTSDGGIHRHRPVDGSGSLSSPQQPGQHRIPNALSAHPAMPCPDRLPRPEDRRHITPSDPTPIAIDNSFDHLAGITKRPALLACTYRQQILDQQPLGIRQHLEPRHTLAQIFRETRRDTAVVLAKVPVLQGMMRLVESP